METFRSSKMRIQNRRSKWQEYINDKGTFHLLSFSPEMPKARLHGWVLGHFCSHSLSHLSVPAIQRNSPSYIIWWTLFSRWHYLHIICFQISFQKGWMNKETALSPIHFQVKHIYAISQLGSRLGPFQHFMLHLWMSLVVLSREFYFMTERKPEAWFLGLSL